MPIVNSIAHKKEMQYMPAAVCVPGMAQIKLTLFTGKSFSSTSHFSSSRFTNVLHIPGSILWFGIFLILI